MDILRPGDAHTRLLNPDYLVSARHSVSKKDATVRCGNQQRALPIVLAHLALTFVGFAHLTSFVNSLNLTIQKSFVRPTMQGSKRVQSWTFVTVQSINRQIG